MLMTIFSMEVKEAQTILKFIFCTRQSLKGKTKANHQLFDEWTNEWMNEKRQQKKKKGR